MNPDGQLGARGSIFSRYLENLNNVKDSDSCYLLLRSGALRPCQLERLLLVARFEKYVENALTLHALVHGGSAH